jgi:NADH:ubiquinone oxidoreductase subunit 3 (subunit A)
MALQEQILMDKYLLVVLGFLMIGIPIAFIEPATGELREQPFILLFYASIGGIIAVIVYSSYQAKKERQRANKERRRKFKK